MFTRNTNRGYTIIETVVYIGLFAMLSLAFTQTMITIMKSYTQVEGNRDILDASHVVMERVAREIRGATSVSGSSVFHATDSDVYVVNTGNTIRIRKNGTNIELYQNGVLSGTLNPASVQVTSFSATRITGSHGDAIKYSLTFRNTKGVIVAKTFYNTVVLRGAY